MKVEQGFIKNVGKWGNSGGILLPREWIGNQVKIILINRTNEIRKEVLKTRIDSGVLLTYEAFGD